MKDYIIVGSFFILSLMAYTSCNRDHELQNDFVDLSQDIGTQQDLLESNETEVNSQVEAAGLLEPSTRTYPTRTWSAPKGTYPNTLTIDYGSAGVPGVNGHLRKGKLIIHLTLPIWITGAIRTVNHEDFYIDDVKVQGTVVLTNKGLNGSNVPVFERLVNQRILIFPSGKTMSWNSVQNIVQIQGADSPLNKLDDVFSFDGISSGINRAGKNFEVTTTVPLEFKASCFWIVKGSINITLESKQLVLNYGNGECNNLVTLTLPDGTVREMAIRRWW